MELQKSDRLFERIVALPAGKQIAVFCYIFGMVQVRGFTEEELKAIESEIIQKESEGNNPSPF